MIFLAIVYLPFISLYSQSNLDFRLLMNESERNPDITKLAKQVAFQHNLPINIVVPDEAIIYPIAVENDNIIYGTLLLIGLGFDLISTWLANICLRSWNLKSSMPALLRAPLKALSTR